MKKRCTMCKLVKDESKFSFNGVTTLSDGTQKSYYKSKCKSCQAAHNKNTRRTDERTYLISQWSNIKQRCEFKRGYIGMSCPDQDEYVNWALSRDDFYRHFDNWVKSGFDLQKSPSIDRIDVNGDYTFDNMQFISFAENSLKDRGKQTTMVFNGAAYTFNKRSDAKRATGLSYRSLYKLLSGESEQIKGWSIVGPKEVAREH